MGEKFQFFGVKVPRKIKKRLKFKGWALEIFFNLDFNLI